MSIATAAHPLQVHFPAHMPTFLMAHEKDSTPRHRPARYLPDYRFWHPNSHDTTCALIVDIDSSTGRQDFGQALTAGLPAPHWLIEKDSNGHVQAGWFIEHVSHGPNSHTHPQDYARAVRQALTNALGGDQNFTNARAWNPFWSHWDEHGRCDTVDQPIYTLGELREALTEADLWNPIPPQSHRIKLRRSAAVTPSGYSWNCYVFDMARTRLSGTVHEAVIAANATLPSPGLPARDIRSITRSITRYEARVGGRRAGGIWIMSAEQREQQRVRGTKGGSRNTDKQRAARAKGSSAASAVRSAEAIGQAATIRSLFESGYTRTQIAERMDVSRTTIWRALKDASD